MTSPFLKQVRDIEDTGRQTVSPEEYLQLRTRGFTDEQIRSELDVLEPPPDHPFAALWRKVARPAIQGATLGFSDELRGAGAAMVPGGDDYIMGRNKEREALAASKREAPILSRVSEFAGGIAAPLGVVAKGIKAGGLLGAVGRGAVTGAVSGGAANIGYGTAKDPEGTMGLGDMADRGLTGAAGGAVIGGITGGALYGAGKVVDKARHRYRQVGKFFDRLAGEDTPPPDGPPPNGPPPSADPDRLGLAPDEYQAFMAKVKQRNGPTQRTRFGTYDPAAEPSPLMEAIAASKAPKQRGPTRAQFQHREEMLGLPRVTPDPPQGLPVEPSEPQADLIAALSDFVRRQQVNRGRP